MAGVSEDGSLLDFHISEVRVRELIRKTQNVDACARPDKIWTLAPAAGENIKDLDKIVLDRMPGYNFKPVLESIEDRLVLLNGDQQQPQPFVSIQNVAKRWNGQLGVANNSDIEEGSFVALLGPSDVENLHR